MMAAATVVIFLVGMFCARICLWPVHHAGVGRKRRTRISRRTLRKTGKGSGLGAEGRTVWSILNSAGSSGIAVAVWLAHAAAVLRRSGAGISVALGRRIASRHAVSLSLGIALRRLSAGHGMRVCRRALHAACAHNISSGEGVSANICGPGLI